MALTLKTSMSEVVLTRERTYQLTVHNRLGEVARIEALREQVVLKGDEITKLLTDRVPVNRNFADVANETVELVGRPGDPITVGQLWSTVAHLLDRWAIQDDPGKALAEPFYDPIPATPAPQPEEGGPVI